MLLGIDVGGTHTDAVLVGDEGVLAFSEMLLQWNEDGTMPLEVWAGSSGSTCAPVDSPSPARTE